VSLAGATRVDSKAQTGLDWLLGARLVLAGMSLGLAVTIDRLEVDQDHPGIWGVYWTIVAAFTATIVSALMGRRTEDPARFATLQVGFDVAIVTSLVYFSGASESVFTFLYALVILYGALVLDRGGVAFSSALAALGYGLVLFGSELGWLPAMGGPGRDRSLAIVGAYWGFLGGALLLLGMLANTLSAELRRTGAALDRRTTDLRRLRDLHQRTVESIGSGILTVDEQGRVTSFNPEAERITGLDASAATGRPLDSLIPGAWPFVLGEAQAGIDGEGSIGRDRLAYRNARDEDLYLGLAHSKLRGEDGGSVGHVVIFQDVSAVVSMERDLRRSERLAAVGEMAARMAHEIRNPLASISGSVQILQSRPDVVAADPEHEHLMGIVVREVDRLNGLISDFLRYSRPAPIKPEPVRLAALIEEIAEVSAGRDDGEVEVELDLDHSAVVLADPDQLRAVIWNLWNNALEAMGGVGRLSARVAMLPRDLSQEVSPVGRNRESGGSTPLDHSARLAWLEIEDTGRGIEPEDLERIFEPFFTSKQDGTGLGLATVQRLVEQHEGAIEVDSRPGEGTCFRVLLACVES
jgi:two-component system sensor histidine kinase PilS (NtrC family)